MLKEVQAADATILHDDRLRARVLDDASFLRTNQFYASMSAADRAHFDQHEELYIVLNSLADLKYGGIRKTPAFGMSHHGALYPMRTRCRSAD